MHSNLIIYSNKRNCITKHSIHGTTGLDNPIAIRYPRGRGVTVDWIKPYENIKIGKAICLVKEQRPVLSNGPIGKTSLALTNLGNPEQ
jgi:1-deoxy-D-xylulose-5-phosphate synthase